MNNVITATDLPKSFSDSIKAENRGTTVSIYDMYPRAASKMLGKKSIHDSNFAFYTTTLAKLDPTLYEPEHNVTYARDMYVDVSGGGFVDYVTYYSVDYAGMMKTLRNVVGNDGNFVPRINASLTKNSLPVYTWQVAYDLRFIELEKMKKLDIQKSIQEIYQNGIVIGWDQFVNTIAYLGLNDGTTTSYGLFNNPNVPIATITNTAAAGDTQGNGFDNMTDTQIVAFINGIFSYYLTGSNMNFNLLPDTILLPSYCGITLSSRFSNLYTSTLREFVKTHNLGIDEMDNPAFKVKIESRPMLDDIGSTSCGRIVAYRNDKKYVKLIMPYPMQHFITLPNIDKMSYTSAFVGQVSVVQLPYNTSESELGAVTYWDFTNKAA